ncbi:DedA family protein [Paenibacillus sp. P96]|uniref:DedA family protein n=1 Tax=Paenibacillus zeirhizosphaerae TaxID=2987519 RepID=A0ABT9FUE1_9BACL|nr:DedA family protein [Paenibacillus sp. P96]MDP4098323.1 DedA family protein [Paenibacillus sp. P96]
MDVLEWIGHLFESYGYSVLFVGLLLEFIALPFPGETTMAYSGYLSYTGALNYYLLIILAFLGTTIGMTITYWIGRKAGLPFIQRFGKWVLLRPDKLEKTQSWFQKYGNGLIFIGYFIPGVRHFTGYFAGIIALPFRKFAAYAYSGALFWVILFISIGKVFGPQWDAVFHLAEMYAVRIVAFAGAVITIIVLIRYRQRIFRRSTPVMVKRKEGENTD